MGEFLAFLFAQCNSLPEQIIRNKKWRYSASHDEKKVLCLKKNCLRFAGLHEQLYLIRLLKKIGFLLIAYCTNS